MRGVKGGRDGGLGRDIARGQHEEAREARARRTHLASLRGSNHMCQGGGGGKEGTRQLTLFVIVRCIWGPRKWGGLPSLIMCTCAQQSNAFREGV